MLSYTCHSFYGLYRIFTTSRFTTKHQSISTIENSICNICNLSTCWTRIFDHCMKHLCSNNNRFTLTNTTTNNTSLNTRNLFDRNLNTQITTGNHYTIACINNLFDIINTLLIFNFRNNLNITVTSIQNILYSFNISRITNKTMSNEINIKINSQIDVPYILLCQSWQFNMFSRNIYTLMGTQNTIILNLGNKHRT